MPFFFNGWERLYYSPVPSRGGGIYTIENERALMTFDVLDEKTFHQAHQTTIKAHQPQRTIIVHRELYIILYASLLLPQHNIDHRIHIPDVHAAVTGHIAGSSLIGLAQHHVDDGIDITNVHIPVAGHITRL